MPGFQARRAAFVPYQPRKTAPPHVISVRNQAWSRTTAPRPKTPAEIRARSASEQNAADKKTCWRLRPWRSTNAFWAPMAMMSDAPRPKPSRRAKRKGTWLCDRVWVKPHDVHRPGLIHGQPGPDAGALLKNRHRRAGREVRATESLRPFPPVVAVEVPPDNVHRSGLIHRQPGPHTRALLKNRDRRARSEVCSTE